jgi:hypothetical protein
VCHSPKNWYSRFCRSKKYRWPCLKNAIFCKHGHRCFWNDVFRLRFRLEECLPSNAHSSKTSSY